MSIGMDRYVDARYGGRQTRIDSSIIKSSDHGLHWSRPMKENRDSPMFPGMRFATPFFIHFGKEYAAATVDNADRYVYATSNDGFWDNGDNYILGRVPRSKISALNAADWTFYKGGDGMIDSSWTHGYEPSGSSSSMPRDSAVKPELPICPRSTGMSWQLVLSGWHRPRRQDRQRPSSRSMNRRSLGAPGSGSRSPHRTAGVVHPEGVGQISVDAQGRNFRPSSPWPETGEIPSTIGTPWCPLRS